MRDFPVFTTENGVGSLVFKEIPYRGIAYVTIHDSSYPTEFLKECLEFSRAAGANAVYASGHSVLERYPLHTAVMEMSALTEAIPDTDAALFPVTAETISVFGEIYNKKMKNVDNAAYMSERDGREMLSRGDGYFVHKDGALLGIGIVDSERIACIAATQPGAGKTVLAALAHRITSDRVVLEVASTNQRAIELYEAMGFITTKVLSRWYKIF